MNGPRLYAVISGAVATMVVALTLFADEPARAVVNGTARTSFVLFALVYAARPATQLAPSALTRGLLARRKWLGLSFATSHALHFGGIVALAYPDFGAFLERRTPNPVGVASFVALAAMSVTSIDSIKKKMSRRAWKALHLSGMHVAWLVFTVTYAGRLGRHPLYVVPFAILVALALVRAAAFVRQRRRRTIRAASVTAIVLVVLAGACGDDGSGATPDAPPATPCGADDDREPSARFTVIPEPGAGSRIGSQVGGQLMSGPPPRFAATLLTEGTCRFAGPSPTLCDPACTNGDVCDIDGSCVAFPETLAAGALRVTGTTPAVTLTPQPGNSYYAQMGYPGLFRAGDELTIALEGAGAVAPLSATVRGVPPITLPTTQLTAREHQPMIVRWDPIANPAGAEVLVHFDSDHHGVRAFLECTAPASAGTVTIPAAVLDRLILAGETGIGTFIENAWIEVHHQARLVTPRGCAVLETYADEFVNVETIRAP